MVSTDLKEAPTWVTVFTSVATPSNDSRALETSQILRILPCALRLVTGQRVCKMTTHTHTQTRTHTHTHTHCELLSGACTELLELSLSSSSLVCRVPKAPCFLFFHSAASSTTYCTLLPKRRLSSVRNFLPFMQ